MKFCTARPGHGASIIDGRSACEAPGPWTLRWFLRSFWSVALNGFWVVPGLPHGLCRNCLCSNNLYVRHQESGHPLTLACFPLMCSRSGNADTRSTPAHHVFKLHLASTPLKYLLEEFLHLKGMFAQKM